MKLNPDCVRDILLKVEEIPDVHHHWNFTSQNIPEIFPNYTCEEIIYHVRQCELCGFLLHSSHSVNYDYYSVSDLTPSGHEFLNNVRENTVWNGVKEVAVKVGATSLSALIQISSNVITQLIKAQFGLL